MEYLDKLLPWMAEHWALTMVIVWCITRWRPLTLVDARHETNAKAKTKVQAKED